MLIKVARRSFFSCRLDFPKPVVSNRYISLLADSCLFDCFGYPMHFNEVDRHTPKSNSDEPLISILTVTLNASACLPGLIESVRQQNLTSIEWVIVDGASTDGTVDQIIDASDVIARYISEPDHGFYHALNKAVSLARGHYYMVIGADDRFDKGAFDALRASVNKAGDVKAIILFAVRRSGKVVRPHQPSRSRLLLGWSFVVASHSVGTLINRTLHRQFGLYSLRYPLLADGYFLSKALQAKVPTMLNTEVIGEFAEGGMTSLDDARIAAETWLIQVHLGHGFFFQTLFFLLRIIKSFGKKQN